MNRQGIIGTGVVGSALTLLLREKGYIISGIYSLTGVSASRLAADIGIRAADRPQEVLRDSEIVFLTTPDRVLAGLACQLAESGIAAEGKFVYHMSGALPAEILHPLRASGALIGSLHPLQSFANAQVALQNLPGSFYALQGDAQAVAMAGQIVGHLDGKPFVISKEDKPLYHLGASVASNYLVALIDMAVHIYRQIGMTSEGALEALLPLIKGTLSNIEKLGPVRALTGPIARGDAETIKGHLHAATELEPELINLYRNLGLYTVKVAERKGTIDGNAAEKLKSILRKDGI